MCNGQLDGDNSSLSCACLPGFELPFVSGDLCVPVPSATQIAIYGGSIGGGLALIIIIIVVIVIVRRRRGKGAKKSDA